MYTALSEISCLFSFESISLLQMHIMRDDLQSFEYNITKSWSLCA